MTLYMSNGILINVLIENEKYKSTFFLLIMITYISYHDKDWYKAEIVDIRYDEFSIQPSFLFYEFFKPELKLFSTEI